MQESDFNSAMIKYMKNNYNKDSFYIFCKNNNYKINKIKLISKLTKDN